ncbi:unnamed protein product [Ilex paraguariensis]|uniref:Peroxisomal and mitochondrial division factor 2-like n=1 Tax=Ilex paraguariensis TaxID=185542 RepID=A0ABC8U9W9_9AQUA
MADEITINGADDDRTVDIEDSDETYSKDSLVLIQKIEGLETEKLELEKDKAELKKEMETLSYIAARAADLETEVSRLQHQLIESQEANAESAELNRVIEELKERERDKGLILEAVEKERNLLLQSREQREGKIGELEGRISEREGEIRVLNEKIGELEGLVMKNRLEIEKEEKEREELEIVKNELEGLLKKSESRVKEMEKKVRLLEEELGERGVDCANGKGPVVVDRGVIGDGDKGRMSLKVEWPVVAVGSVGAVAVFGVVCYLQCARKR